MARDHGVSSAQAALRWLVQQGIAVVTAGSNPAHLAEDVAVTDFQLSEEAMATLAQVGAVS